MYVGAIRESPLPEGCRAMGPIANNTRAKTI